MQAGHFGPNNFYQSLIDLSCDPITHSSLLRRFFNWAVKKHQNLDSCQWQSSQVTITTPLMAKSKM
jgi:hypothetical protein